jgi:lysophospholipase L1-like esterase
LRIDGQPRLIAALGSSFAAGPTIEPVDNINAMRSARNYPHLLARTLGAALIDLTVSGATTANILTTPQTTVTGRTFAPQMDGLPADADLVTITAGGNDLRFIGSMLYAAWSRHEPGGPIARMLGQGFEGGLPIVSDHDVELTATGLQAIVAATRERAEHARIVLVDYLTVVTEQTAAGPGEVFTLGQLSEFLRTQAALAEAYRIAADRTGAELLAASAMSTEHGLGSDDPWVFGFVPVMTKTAGSFHPNEAGMRAIAEKLSDMVG